jgi:hypothetical protein
MSSAALARKRRANGVTDSPPPTPQSQPKVGLTLTQVFSVIDTRLKQLENSKSEKKSETSPAVDTFTNDLLQEYEARFQMLATEMQELKDTIMKLQTFTMEVNHVLFKERQLETQSIPEDVVVNTKEKSTFDSMMETLREEDE